MYDLKNKRFGRLTVMEFSENQGSSSPSNCRWKCRCDCGNETNVVAYALTGGGTQSCGCLRSEIMARLNARPMLEKGMRFGKLVTLGTFTRLKGLIRYNCECDCGKSTAVTKGNLVNGTTLSCGCLRSIDRRKEPGGVTSRNRVILTYKKTARNRNICFTLNEADLIRLFSGNCFYCGASPSNTAKDGLVEFTYNGIDRINSDIGYCIENCVSCCWTCNRMKGCLTHDEFLTKITQIFSKNNSYTEVEINEIGLRGMKGI